MGAAKRDQSEPAGEAELRDDTTLFDPLELYAGGIDTSDYVDRVAPCIRELVGDVGDLLDVGAGGGQLGAALSTEGHRWTAIEPSLTMQRRLRARARAPRLLATGWDGAHPSHDGYDTVLAANMPAPLVTPVAFLARCREWSRRTIVWVVPAQNGPRGLCLAGCLPAAWHGEDETPGVDICLRQLPPADHPDAVTQVAWSFRLRVPSVEAISAYLAGRLGWAKADPRRSELVAHLSAAAEPVGQTFQLTVPRQSAILVWGQC